MVEIEIEMEFDDQECTMLVRACHCYEELLYAVYESFLVESYLKASLNGFNICFNMRSTLC